MWLTACPAESEQPGMEINYFHQTTVNTISALRKEHKKDANKAGLY
jgi:hypothetical protein